MSNADDNRTTELLCKLLEEHGIEWKDGDAAYEIEWSTPDGRHCSAMYWKPTFTVLISGCTPEQAIAATLVSEREKALEELVRDAYWLIVRAIWSHESQDKFATDWTERVSVLGIEVD